MLSNSALNRRRGRYFRFNSTKIDRRLNNGSNCGDETTTADEDDVCSDSDTSIGENGMRGRDMW